MFNAEWNILYYIYHILDYTILLSMDLLNNIYHILFKPAINYNYYADTIQE